MKFTKYFIAGKDYLLVPDINCHEAICSNRAITLCDRTAGVGADGIFTFQQNNTKNIEISGLLQNGQIMRDFSSASICACFDTFSKTDVTNLTFSFENQAFSELNCDFSGDTAQIFCRIPPTGTGKATDCINRRTEIGNRILTVTAVELSGIHGVHFSQCRNLLDINYLGRHFSRNSLFNKQADFILAQKTDDNTYEIDFYENCTGNPRPTACAFMSVALASIRTGQQKYNEKLHIVNAGNCVSIVCRSDESFDITCDIRRVFTGST